MKNIRIRTPEKLVRRLGHGGYITQSRIAEAFGSMKAAGYVCALPPTQARKDDAIAFIRETDGRAALAEQIQGGRHEFPRAEVEAAVRMSIRSDRALVELAKAGIGVTSLNGDTVHLAGVNAPLARIVNASRSRNGRRGYRATTVVAAAIGRPRQAIRRVTVEQRIDTALCLQELNVNGEDLLNETRYARIYSRSPKNGNGHWVN